MAETKKIRMKVSRGNPAGGPIIRAGATVELPLFWANKFIADGTAEEVTDTASASAAKPEKKNGGKNKKGKS